MTDLDLYSTSSRLTQSRGSCGCDEEDGQRSNVGPGGLCARRRSLRRTTSSQRSRATGTGSRNNGHATRGIIQTSQSNTITEGDKNGPSPCVSSLIDLDPPITETSLRQLDLSNLIKNPYLRHDLFFDGDLLIRPNGNTKIVMQRLQQSQQYWTALSQDLASYLNPCRPIKSEHTNLTRCLNSLVPRMFMTIQRIIVTLVTENRRASVRARLDPEILLQQMEHCMLDIADLSGWFGQQLTASCSPERDHLVLKMVSMMRRGALESDLQLIVESLKQLFSILEIMKLDVANHQIKRLRNSLLDENIAFERSIGVRWIEAGWDSEGANAWLRNYAPSEDLDISSSAPSTSFTSALLDLTASNTADLPVVLTLDHTRLQSLQHDLHFLRFQAACQRIFKQTLFHLAFRRVVTHKACTDLARRIAALIRAPDLANDVTRQQQAAALEIARSAYGSSKISTHPSCEMVQNIETMLSDACTPTSCDFEFLTRHLIAQLKDLVANEVQAIKNLSPVQILNRHTAQAKRSRVKSRVVEEPAMLRNMAQRLAHIAVLHWRVWAPILYRRCAG